MSKNNSRNFNTFGKALKWLLDEAGYSQKWLSDQTEIDTGTISKYVNGDLNPPRKRRVKNFESVIGGKLEKQPNGDWTASIDEKVKNAIDSVDEVKEQSNSYKAEKLSLDEIAQDLQFAKQTIERSLKRIERLRDSDH